MLTYYEIKIAKVVALKFAALESFLRYEPTIVHARVRIPLMIAIHVPIAGEVNLD